MALVFNNISLWTSNLTTGDNASEVSDIVFFSLLNLLFYEAIYEGLMRFHFHVYNE